MTEKIVQTLEPIILFGGGEVHDSSVLRAMAVTDRIAAADGGAKHAMRNNIIPDVVIGDFDSLTDEDLTRLPADALHRITEQDSTDFDKALRSIEAPLVIALGFTGARLDHTLAAMNTLVARSDRRCVLLDDHQLAFVAPRKMELELPIGTVFSLFPMGAVHGTSEGLKWPIDGLDFSPSGRVGTSNEVSGPVKLEFNAPNMLVLLPAAQFESTIGQLMHCSAHWPALAG